MAELARRLCEPWERDGLARELVARHPDGMTLEEVGEYFGLTRERVRQIEAIALLKLRNADSPARAKLEVYKRTRRIHGRE